jgi:hypothetical protein
MRGLLRSLADEALALWGKGQRMVELIRGFLQLDADSLQVVRQVVERLDHFGEQDRATFLPAPKRSKILSLPAILRGSS